MSEGKHTPGPWEYVRDEDGSFDVCQQTGAPITTWSSDVCRVYQINGTQPEDVAEANARLIAAAPELLEALELLVEDFTEQGDYEDYERLKSVIKTRAAIAKARAA